MQTFSVAFDDREFDESPYQKGGQRLSWGPGMAKCAARRRTSGGVFPEVVRHTEQPILRTAPAPLYLLSGLVRDGGTKVVVTGEGAG